MPSRTFIATEEKSMPGFKGSKDRLTLLLGADVAGDLSWSQYSTILKILGPLKMMLNLWALYVSQFDNKLYFLKKDVQYTLPLLYQWNNTVWMTAHLLTTWFTVHFKLTVESYCSEKKRFLSKYYCSLSTHLVILELWQRSTMRLVLFSCLLPQHLFCSPWVKE